MTEMRTTAQAAPRRLSPLWRTAVICFVGLIVSGALIALSLFTRNVDLFVILTLVATAISAGVGVFAGIQGWRESQRAAARGAHARSAAIALAAGLMLVVTAVAISGAIWISLLFFL